MKYIDGDIRVDPNVNKAWLRAFKKAQLGWGNLSLYEEYKKLHGHGHRYYLQKAEEHFTCAKQILADEGLRHTELEDLIDESLLKIAELTTGEIEGVAV